MARSAQAARTSTVGGFINFVKDDFGRQLTTYNGIPLVEPYPENDGVEPLANSCDASQRLRADAVSETDQRARFQAIAPSTEQGLYLVPRVIE